jgi:hypothetical protein
MSELKKIMGVISGSSAPRPVMTLLEKGVGDRTSTHYEKYAPKNRIILSVVPNPDVSLEPSEPVTDAVKTASKEGVRSVGKDFFSVLIEVLLPDGIYHPIAEYKRDGIGTGELIVDDMPSNWRLSVTTKSKHSYSVFGY